MKQPAKATYTVESSGNLQSWSVRATGVTTGTYTDTQARSATARFYRVQVE